MLGALFLYGALELLWSLCMGQNIVGPLKITLAEQRQHRSFGAHHTHPALFW